MAEIRRSGTWGSALTSDEFAAIRSVGFEPAGQVLGAAVYNIGYSGRLRLPGRMGQLLAVGYAARRRGTQVSSRGGYGLVRAAGADAVPGPADGDQPDGGRVRGTRRPRRRRRPAHDRQFPGRRARVQGDRHRGARPRRAAAQAARSPPTCPARTSPSWCTAGWMPAGLALGISVAARHDDWRTVGQTRWGAGNAEVSGWTELVNDARHDARVAAGDRRQADRRRGRGRRRDEHAGPRAGVPGPGGRPRSRGRGGQHRHRDRAASQSAK